MATKTLNGPGGIRLELDTSEVFEDEPGAGTPAMVYLGRHGGTYWCAVDTGELGDITLSRSAMRWLENQTEIVEDFLYPSQGDQPTPDFMARAEGFTFWD